MNDNESYQAGQALRELISKIGSDVVGGAKEIASHPVKSFISTARGAVGGTAKGLSTLFNIFSAPYRMLPDFMLPPGGKEDFKKIGSSLYNIGKKIEGQPETPTQKFLTTDIGETLPALIPAVRVTEATTAFGGRIPLLGKLLSSGASRVGLDLAFANQLLLDPNSTEEGREIINRIEQFKNNYLGGVLGYITFGAAGKVLGKVGEPISKAVRIPTEKVFTSIQKGITEDYFKTLSPIMPDILKRTDILTMALDSMAKKIVKEGETLDQYELQSIASRDFLDILQGKKDVTPIFNTDFWKEVAKKYGLSEENYPVEITLPVKKVDTEAIKSGVAGLLKSPPELVNEFKDFLIQTAKEQALVNDNAFAENLSVINMMTEDLEKKGYSVNQSQVINFIDRATQFLREDRRFKDSVSSRDVLTSTYNEVKDRLQDHFTDLQRLKLYLGRFGEENGYNAWETYLRHKGIGTDVVFDELRRAGLAGEDELLSPSRIIEIANSIPTKSNIPKVIPPEPFNIEEEAKKLLTPKEKIVETPYVVPKSVAEKTELQSLLEKEKTITENATDNVISNLPVDKQIEYKTVKGIIEQAPIPEEDKISVSKFYDNLYLVSSVDSKDVPQLLNTLDAIKSQSRVWIDEIKTIANYDLDNGSKKTTSIASIIEGLKDFLSGKPFLRDWVSTQNKLTSAKLGKPAAYLSFMYSNVNPIRFLSEKTRDAVINLIPKEERSIFAKAYEEGKIDTLSEGSQKAAQIWKAYSDTILDIINDLRLELGKDPIPKIDRYFPRQLTQVLVDAMNDAVKKDTLFTPEGTNHLLSRTLDSLGQLHSNNPEIALKEYVRQTNFHTDYLLKELINRETRHWDEDLKEQLLHGLRSNTPSLTGKEADFFVADLFTKPAKAVENALNKSGIIHTIERVPISDELKEAVLASPDLSSNPGIKALLDKGYWDLRAVNEESVYNTIRKAMVLPSLAKLMLNTSFTLVNMTQTAQEVFKMGGGSSITDILKGYTKGYIAYPLRGIIKFVAPEFVEDLERTASLGRALGYIEGRFGVYGEGMSLLDHFGKIGRLLSANIKLTELGNRISSHYAFLSRIQRKMPDLSPEEARVLASNLSAFVNFVSGRYMSPSIKKGIGGSSIYQFMQFPVSDGYLTLANWQNILSKDKPLAEVYKNIFLSIGDKDLMDKALAQVDKLTPGQLDSLVGLMFSGLTVATSIVATFNIFNIIHSLITDSEPYISTTRAKQEAIQTMIPFAQLQGKFATGGTPTYASTPKTDVSLPLQSPTISFIASIGNMLKGLSTATEGIFEGDPQKASDGYDYFWLSTYQAAPTFIQRIQDWYDLVTTGGIPQREIGSEKVQYKLEKGESPLTLLFFGRGTTSGYEKLEKAREEELKARALNEEAARAFMAALEETDPIKKEQKFNIYKKLVNKGAAPITRQSLEQRLKYSRLTAPERRLQSLPKAQRYRILEEINGGE